MAGGRIYHWKHGWIPLTPVALRSKLKQGPPPKGNRTGGALTNAERRTIANMERKANGQKPLPRRGRVDTKTTQADRISDTLTRGRKVNREAERAEAAHLARVEARADRREVFADHEVVDGVEFVTYPGSHRDPLGSEHGQPYTFTPEQKELLADAYNRVMKDFPDAEPVRIVGVDGTTGAFGITAWDGRRISISSDSFSDERREQAADAWGDHGAIAGQYAVSAEAFPRAIMVHELGHALQMQKQEVRRAGEAMAREKVRPADIGVDIPPYLDKPDQFTRIRPSEAYAPRWAVDTLDNQSAYATANEYEWFAEAFTDGWLNRGGATPQGKRALDLIRQAYNGQTKEAAA